MSKPAGKGLAKFGLGSTLGAIAPWALGLLFAPDIIDQIKGVAGYGEKDKERALRKREQDLSFLANAMLISDDQSRRKEDRLDNKENQLLGLLNADADRDQQSQGMQLGFLNSALNRPNTYMQARGTSVGQGDPWMEAGYL